VRKIKGREKYDEKEFCTFKKKGKKKKKTS
jgi:hypothetical protein